MQHLHLKITSSTLSRSVRLGGTAMFELGSYLPYLVRRISARVDDIIRPELAAAGLTLEKWRVVITIYVHGPQSLGALAERTSVNLSTLSRLVGAMERQKLVRRRRVEGNGRTVTIDLLPRGRERCEYFLPFALDFEKSITRRFSESDLADLRELLARFYAVVSEDRPPLLKPRSKSARRTRPRPEITPPAKEL